jgi:cyclopropane fatty-acyl-phospholipid synthase-like methyltransferase
MRTLSQRLLAQFRKPEGALGWLAGVIMASRQSNRQRNLWTVGLLGIRPGDHVLEIGCGPGLAVAGAATRVGEGRVTGIDHSTVMVRQAKARNRAAIAAGQVRILQGSLSTLSDMADRFDAAFSVNVLQFIGDKTHALITLKQALRPGAILATTYMPRTAGALSTDDFAADLVFHLRATGFVEPRIERLPLKPAPAVCVLAARPHQG